MESVRTYCRKSMPIFQNVDVIMVTAANENHMLEKAIRNGVSNYLIKPVTLEKFVRTIEDIKERNNYYIVTMK